jgi:hypothetical protein
MEWETCQRERGRGRKGKERRRGERESVSAADVALSGASQHFPLVFRAHPHPLWFSLGRRSRGESTREREGRKRRERRESLFNTDALLLEANRQQQPRAETVYEKRWR